MNWKFAGDRPVYQQIMAAIRGAILKGELPPGGKVPSVRDLAAQLEQVQAESDYEEAMALYQLSREQDSQQAQTQKAMAALLAQAGDFSLYGALYGLTQEQIRRLEEHYRAQQAQ